MAVARPPDAGVAPPSPPEVDWCAQVLRVRALGPPRLTALNPSQVRRGAQVAATEAGHRRLLDLARALPVDGARSLGAAVDDARLRGAVSKARQVEQRILSDDGVVLVLELPLANLAATLLSPPTPRSTVAADAGAAAGPIVIDATGLGASPGLGAALLDPGDVAIEGPARAGRLPASFAWGRAGACDARPAALTLRAVKAAGPRVWLSADDAAALRAASKTGDVVIVVGEAGAR